MPTNKNQKKPANQSETGTVIAGKKNKKSPMIFYLIMIAIPILFFAFLEIGLRISNYGRNYEVFIPSDKFGKDMLEINSDISYKYFNNINVFNSDSKFFYKVKRKNSFRVFVIGESSVQGFPYNINASFPSYIKRRLDLVYPNTEIEVINMGASAISSFTMLDIVPEVLKQDPDLILIYAGHNEYYGALGAASTMSLGKNRRFVNFMLYLRGFKTVELLRNIMSSASTNNKKEDQISLMQKMIGESAIPFGSEVYKRGINNFEGNLKEILERINAAKVPVMLSTLTSNIKDQKPFVSNDRENTIDAEAYFKKGHDFLQKGDKEKAKVSFMKAKELDGLRFRAPQAINDIIRKLAADNDIPLVDVDSLFNVNASSGIVGNDLMCDHLHPNIKGYQLIGKGFFEGMMRADLVPKEKPIMLSNEQQDSILIASLPYTRLDSMKAQFVVANMLSSYPFVPNGRGLSMEKLKPKKFVEKMSMRRNIDSARAVVAYYYFKERNYNAFSREMHALINHSLYNEVNYISALLLLSQDNFIAEASPYIEAELKKQKPNASIYKMMGFLYQLNGNYKSSIDAYNKAVELRPEDHQLFFGRALTYQQQQEYVAAIKDYDKAIELNAEFIEAYHNRGSLKYLQRDFVGTIADFDEIIELKPKDAMAYLTRGHAQVEKGDHKAGCKDWLQAAELGSEEARFTYNKECR